MDLEDVGAAVIVVGLVVVAALGVIAIGFLFGVGLKFAGL